MKAESCKECFRRGKPYFLLGMHLLFFLLLLGGYVLPTAKQVLFLRRESRRVESRLQQVRQFARRYDGEREAALYRERALLRRQIPEKLSTGAAMEKITLLAEQSGLTLLGVEPDKVRDRGFCREQSFTVRLKGSYFQLLLFTRLIRETSEAGFLEYPVITLAEDQKSLLCSTKVVSFATQIVT
jgi:Tfp pilus assembly protein PilO